MIKKFLIFNFVILILTSCGYSPMLSNNANLNFGVTSYEFSGNKQIKEREIAPKTVNLVRT